MWPVFFLLAGVLALGPVKDYRVGDMSSYLPKKMKTVSKIVKPQVKALSNTGPTIGLDASIQALWTDSSNSIYYLNSTINDNKSGYTEVFPLLLDTGSGLSWIYNTSCTASACLNAPKFEDTDSLYSTVAFTISYTGQTISGSLVDTLHNNLTFSFPYGLALANYSFGLATSAPLFFNDYNVSGIIGIPSAYDDSIPTNFIAQLHSSGSIANRKFGLILGSSSNSNSSFGGLLLFGDSASDNAEKLATSDVEYCSLDKNTHGYWLVSISAMTVTDYQNQTNPMKNFNSTKQAIIDTGTTGLSLPLADADALHSALFSSLYISDGVGNYAFLCNATGAVDFTIDGKNFTIPVENIRGDAYLNNVLNGYCASKALGSTDTTYWILGASFLKSFYTIFDLDNFKIGFAPCVESFATSTAALSSSATSASSTILSNHSSNLTTSSSRNEAVGTSAGLGAVVMALICMLY